MKQRNVGAAVLMVVGLACYWPFFRRFEFSLFFANRADASDALWWSYGIVMASCILFSIMCAVLHARIERLVDGNRTAAFAIGCASAAGYALLLWSEAPFLVVLLASILLGGGYVALTCLWAIQLSRNAGTLPLVSMAASFPISAVLSLVILLPEPASIATTALAPVASALAWRLSPATQAGAAPAPARALRAMPLAPLGIFCLFIIVGHLIVGALYQTEGYIPVSERIITIALSSVTMLLVAFLIARSSSAERVLRKSWVLLAAFYLAAAFLVLYAGSDLYHLGTGIIQAELNCFELCFWILLVVYLRRTGASAVLAFCVGFLAFKAIPVSVAKLFLPSLFNLLSLRPADYTATFVAIMTFMLVVITVVFLNTRALGAEVARTTQKEPPGERGEERLRADACALLASSAGLTPREEEVMNLVAQGNSLKKVGETLFISTGTVQGHTKNIYRKLDVHSKQELIDLVSDRRRQA